MSAPLAHLVLDLDGTLSDPALGVLNSINYALAQQELPPIAAESIGRYIGPPLHISMVEISGRTDPESIDSLLQAYRERYGAIGYAENKLYPDVDDALYALQSRGVALGVCTSKRTDFAEQVLQHFGLRDYFHFVSGGNDGLAKWQQLEALLADGLISAQSIMVGDRAIDIAAAQKNHLRAAGVLWGHGSRAELSHAGANWLLSSPREWLDLAEQFPDRLPG